MNIAVNLAPFLKQADELRLFLSRWTGAVEVMMDGPDWKDPVQWELDCKRLLGDDRLLSVHGPIWELNLASARYRMIRQYSFETYKECLNWCAHVGARHMVVHPNLYSTPIFSRQLSQQYAKESLKRLGEHAQKVNVALVVENMGLHEYALFDQEQFIRLFEEIDSINALVDVGHAHVNGWNIAEVIRCIGSKLQAVHLHDNDGLNDLHQPIGHGTVAWEPLWTELNKLDQPYWAILEYAEGVSFELLLEHAAMLGRKLNHFCAS